MIRAILLGSTLLAGAAGSRAEAATDPAKAYRPLPGAPAERRALPGERRNLPFSHGRTFATLDQYLEHLRRYAGPVGQPWYRRIRPGLFELVTTMRPPPARRVYTRAQLMAQFGFTR